MNKKRLFAGLLGGGVTLIVASIGGLKLSDKISYDRQIARYEKISKDFLKVGLSKDHNGAWYFPSYLDEAAWERTHKNKYTADDHENKRKRGTFIATYPDWKTFRDWCFAEGAKGFKECHDSSGFCSECARREGWDKN